jgi:hypothetical protein
MPSTEEELIETVKDAAKHGVRLKLVGAGHSFSAIGMCADGSRLVSLDDYHRITNVQGNLVTAQVTFSEMVRLVFTFRVGKSNISLTFRVSRDHHVIFSLRYTR